MAPDTRPCVGERARLRAPPAGGSNGEEAREVALSLSLLNAQEYALFDAGARRVTAPVASDLAHFEFYRLALRASVGLTPAAMTSSGLVQCDDSLSLSLTGAITAGEPSSGTAKTPSPPSRCTVPHSHVPDPAECGHIPHSKCSKNGENKHASLGAGT